MNLILVTAELSQSELSQSLAPITEERASRTLYRISLLRRLRERVLPHPSLEERLLLAPAGSELPAWWSTPDHDRQLMLGASLHGVSRTELSIYADTQFSFSQVHQDFLMTQQNQPQPPATPAAIRPATPLSAPKLEEGEELGVKEEEVEVEAVAGVGAMGAQLQSTPLSHHDGKSRGRSWGFKGERSRGRKAERRAAEGGEEGGRGSDSDSDSESGSSSSERSASSDDSGESDGGTGKASVGPRNDTIFSSTASLGVQSPLHRT